jgi:hypothetical protein
VKELKEVFTEIYNTRGFGGVESVSGHGSDLETTGVLREALPAIIRSLNIRTMLDAPCGDLNWIRQTDLTGIVSYIGLDIVEDLIKKNLGKQLNGAVVSSFSIADITKDYLAKVDLIFCRDCLVHLPDQLVLQTLDNFRRSGSKYLAATTFILRTRNTDVLPGSWRPINLQIHPFNLGEPILKFNEGYLGDEGKYADKSIGVWEL